MATISGYLATYIYIIELLTSIEL